MKKLLIIIAIIIAGCSSKTCPTYTQQQSPKPVEMAIVMAVIVGYIITINKR